MGAIAADLNRTLRGWLECFKHADATKLAQVDGWVRGRLRGILPWHFIGR